MICRYVTHDRILPYLQTGWHILIPREWDYHVQWGMTLVWLCDCKMVEPKKGAA